MITIVTDTSAYFRKDEATVLGVRVVPINYSVGRQNYCESFSDQNGDFENLLRGNANRATWHPNMAAFLSCFEEELEKGGEVLCITMSSRLSGAYGTAHMAAKQSNSDRVAVFDSQLTAGGLYLLVKEAKKLADKGFSLRELMKELPVLRERISIAFSVDDMAPLRSSGRIGFVRLSVGTILNIKPILLCKDGAVMSDGVARGSTELIQRLAEKVGGDACEAVISYIGDSRTVTQLYHVVRDTCPHVRLTLQKMGPVLGIHLGVKVIAVSVLAGQDAAWQP